MTTLHFTTNPDLELIVGIDEERRHFYVSREKIKSAAPLLCAEIDERRNDKSATSAVKLQSFDMESSRLLMLICHHRFDELLRRVSYDTILHLAGLADAFALTDLLIPFVRPWLIPFADHEVAATDIEWLSISWIFGLKGLFASCLNQLIHRSLCDEEGNISVPGMDLDPDIEMMFTVLCMTAWKFQRP